MRVIVVTGSSSGFGAACVRTFAHAGDLVVATMRKPRAGIFDRAECQDIRQLDVTDKTSIQSCIDSILADHGRIDVLVNNAGIHLQGALEDMDEAALREVMETNFHGALNTTREVLPAMRAAGRGHIIAVTSIGAQVGRVMDGAYCASKAALEIALEALRYEVARFGIQVCVVAPGAYRTQIDSGWVAPGQAQKDSPYQALLEFRQEKVRQAIRQGGEPDEVADAIHGIANDPAPAFRHVVGAGAQQLQQALSNLTPAEREALVTRMADIRWWIAGEEVETRAAET